MPLEQDVAAGIPCRHQSSGQQSFGAIAARGDLQARGIKYSGSPTSRMFSVIANTIFIFGLMRTARRQVTHVAEFGGSPTISNEQ
ncbi:hypothetical protein RFM99_34530 [Mesorhizobium sp. VK4C]|uniref:hypothetical protein n=1 Tax=Mesorhizobium captivum TaxID=3072319 RepID=UPI002A23A572|nr:hypothetical protein [Mesorhizobium sp. VK4C]MDX8503475.1 hypothetical protein [Mesorhizobium sp. VK4C]